MTGLRNRSWRLKYTPDDGDLVQLLYLPALESAVSYDRLTGYFSASALALAARGVEALVRNQGNMRMVVGCTLDAPEVAAIEKGENLKAAVDRHLTAQPLIPPDLAGQQALELLAWMVAHGVLDVKVAVPCDHERRPIPSDGIFHEKAGIVVDPGGDRIAFNGSLNETAAGWTRNWESLNLFTSWSDLHRVEQEEANFAKIWAGKANHVITLDVPEAARENLLQFLPHDDRPARLKPIQKSAPETPVSAPAVPVPLRPDNDELRRLVWRYIRQAATLPNGGERVGEATSAVTPWPHQVKAFQRLYDRWPPKLLIADEVGLGKTIEVGLLLRQAWLAGRAKRVLILAPKNVCYQWQVELREKFNLNWPIYDGQKLIWYGSPALRGATERMVDARSWHREPVVIASSHLMRRQDRARELVERAEPWDLVVLDEAHHARRRGAGTASERGPNALLALMRALVPQTQGLVLLTATPMQVHPIEVWDLLRLLGLPPEWTAANFLRFFEEIEQPAPSHEAFDWLASMFRAVEARFGSVSISEVQRLGDGSRLKAKRLLDALRDPASIPRRQLQASDRTIALRLMRLNTPIGRLISRHTRELLRRYYKAGKLSTRIADRQVEDRFIPMSADESALYEAVENYISTSYNQASEKERNAVGFVMTIYRRRLASSFHALGKTLQTHLQAVSSSGAFTLIDAAEDDISDEPGAEEVLDVDEVAAIEREALLLEEKADIEDLLARIRLLPPDTKAGRLREVLSELRAAGYVQAMVFTQYTDTMDFLRRELSKDATLRILCFSGRGGEVPNADGTWRSISRDDAKRRFREGLAEVMLCTDAAAEGLNFQFCGALVNYDMPWNPMRVEQRIGRIDRLGQEKAVIRIVNLHYADTVETDVYMVLRSRIGLFESVVGRLQPILSRLPSLIGESVLHGRGRAPEERQRVAAEIESEAARAREGGFDLDAITEADLEEAVRPEPLLSLADLDLVLARPELLPPGIAAKPLGHGEYSLIAPGMAAEVRVATNSTFYEQHAESVELWSPGSPTFPERTEDPTDEPTGAGSLREILKPLLGVAS